MKVPAPYHFLYPKSGKKKKTHKRKTREKNNGDKGLSDCDFHISILVYNHIANPVSIVARVMSVPTVNGIYIYKHVVHVPLVLYQ